VEIRELAVRDAWEITPRQHGDDRGVFLEWFTDESFRRTTGHAFTVAQANCSVSHRGVLRGIHWSDVPPGQAKYVTCTRGAVLDVAVDLRVGSPTFGAWDAVRLDTVDRRAIYLGEGLGHAFLSLEDDSTVSYLCSTPYSPGREHEINPLDPAIGIVWPSDVPPLLSAKDAAAPTLDEARHRGLLPTWDETRAHIGSLEP
jgi:dTDP-4-dehydrorhamnose 3,5-epimerase